ncbi:hypothetical protein F5Y09DRAFT_341107 [Xylaria sp. FL1042]|nr:hypothetical protein F5Y09DRAFT_341107 [Xylaria sp. FL1042]
MEEPTTPKNKALPSGQAPTPPPSSAPARVVAKDIPRGLNYNSPLPVRAKQHVGKDDHYENDVKAWIYASDTPEKRRERFYSVLHACYPSNDTFNSARHPFYDSEEDGDYEDFIKCQEWDGACPLDDDDYNPLTDPTWSTEVWDPKIGDEGIEDELDLRMVLKARQEHKTRSDALKSYRARGMSFLSLAQKIKSDDSDSGSKFDKGEDLEDQEVAVKTEAPSRQSDSMIQPTTPTKGIVVFGDDKPSKRRRRRRARKNKRATGNNKRKRGSKENPNDTYRYNSDSEDEKPAHKRSKGREKEAPGDIPWKAQTRAATRRAGNMGTDGC